MKPNIKVETKSRLSCQVPSEVKTKVKTEMMTNVELLSPN